MQLSSGAGFNSVFSCPHMQLVLERQFSHVLFPFASIARGMLNAAETSFAFGASAGNPLQKERTAPFVRANMTATLECAVLFRKVQRVCFLSYSFRNTGV